MMFKSVKGFEDDKLYYLVEFSDDANKRLVVTLIKTKDVDGNMLNITDNFDAQRVIRVNYAGEILDPNLYLIDAEEMNNWANIVEKLVLKPAGIAPKFGKKNKVKSKTKKEMKAELELIDMLPIAVRPLFTNPDLVTSIERAIRGGKVMIMRFKKYSLGGKF